MKKMMEGRTKWSLTLRAIFLVVLMSSILATSFLTVDAEPLTMTVYSVTYAANGAVSGSVPIDSNTYAETNSVQVLPNTGGLVREGYVFGGWMNDNSIYQPDDTFTMGTKAVILSAVWIPVYSVSYDGNVNTRGSAPVDPQLYPGGAYITVLTNSKNLDRSFGFECWNTKADGSGSTYYPGNTFPMGEENITLYAIYYTTPPVILITDDYTVTYSRNGATSGFVPIDNTKNADITVSGNTGSLLRNGYAFAGWNTKADGSGTMYQPGDTSYLSASLTLHALWNPVYTVNYDANGGEANTATSHLYPSGSKVKLVDYAGFIQPPGGKVFAGWNTKADGTGTAYMTDDVVTIHSDLTLYPVWAADDSLYWNFIFRGNGNTDGFVPAMSRVSGNQKVWLPGAGTLVRDGYIFDGWFSDSTHYYKAGDLIQVRENDITLYAKWVAVCTVTYDSSNATGGTVPVDSADYTPGVQVTVMNDTGGLSRTDGFFLCWNTKPDGSGSSYWPGASFTISVDTTLYAMYSLVIIVPPEPLGKGVYYYGNRAESGVAPEDSLGYAVGNTVTVQNNTGNLTRYGYIFAGWNTRANGTGATYQPGGTFSYPANKEYVALFAVWNEEIISQIRNLEYNGNGNSGGNRPDNEYIDVGDSLPVSDRNTLYKTGYVFVNWNTHADGSGATYWPGDSISPAGNVIILYAQWTVQTNFTNVTYQVNASYGTYTGTLPTDPAIYQAGGFISVKSSDIAIPGRYFAGWNTRADLTGETYLPGDTIIMEYDNITLYAVFLTSKPFYVYYMGNGNTGGAPPTDVRRYSCGYFVGQTVTVLYQSTLSKGTEYYFYGWNTEPDGSGLPYNGGETFPVWAGDITLYAIWKTYPDSFAVAYNGNGSTSGTLPIGSTLQPSGASVTLPANSGNLLKTDNIFYGWWVNGALYKPGASFTMPSRAVTVYAVWASTATFVETFSVTYMGNGSTGGTVPSDSTSYFSMDSVLLAGNTGNLVRPGYAFGGWSDGISLYVPGQTFTMGSARGNVTLYAVWKLTYNMSYDGNGNTGGSVPVDTSVYTEGQSITVMGNVNNMVRTIYLFDGWYGNGRFYHPGDALVLGTSGVTLTAVWVYAPINVTVTSAAVKTVPAKTTYFEGELLDLAGLVVTLHKSNSTTEDVAFADFTAKGITTTPGNGTGLSVSDTSVNITYTADSKSVSQSITVNPAPVLDVDASISPTSVNYDLNASADVVTTITWNSANAVTDVVYGTTSLITPDAYVVSGSVLTIKSVYVNTLGVSEGDEVKFKISFDKGNSVTLTVNIVDSYIPAANAELDRLTVNGSSVSGFDSKTTIYNVELPYGTASVSVGAIPGDAHAAAVIMQAQTLPGDATVVVTAEDKTTTKSYTIHFTLAAAPTPVSTVTPGPTAAPTPTPTVTPSPTATPTPTPTVTPTSEALTKPTNVESITASESTPTAVPDDTNSTDDDETDTTDPPGGMPQDADIILPVISHVSPDNEDLLVLTIDPTIFPEGTITIVLPDGSSIALDGTDKLIVEVERQQLDTDGYLPIQAMDSSGNVLGEYRVATATLDGAAAVYSADSGFSDWIWCALIIVFPAAAGSIFFIIFKRRKRKNARRS